MFGFSKWRRRRLERHHPLPDGFATVLGRRLAIYRRLPVSDRERLHRLLRVFLAEKHFEGCGGFVVDDQARLIIGALAVVPLLHRPGDACYPNLVSILVYPDAFWVETEEQGPEGVVRVDEDVRSGESWDRGVVILAWEEVEASLEGRHEGYNVVLHEFAHQLDEDDGLTDAVEAVIEGAEGTPWARGLKDEYERFCEILQGQRNTFLDPYGATSPAEFFAVATETFFDAPRPMARAMPRLYALLREYYRQDLASETKATPRRRR